MNKYLKAIIAVVLGAAFCWAGGLTRPYAAFGGEEVVLICAVVYAARILTKKEEEDE